MGGGGRLTTTAWALDNGMIHFAFVFRSADIAAYTDHMPSTHTNVQPPGFLPNAFERTSRSH